VTEPPLPPPFLLPTSPCVSPTRLSFAAQISVGPSLCMTAFTG
jgi:hypothetical protein